MKETKPLFVITGGPGAGKTTLIQALEQQGFPVSREAGRAVIQEQMRISGQALPWGDRNAFAALMLQHEIENYRALADGTGPVFFDRGLPDIIGYMELEGLPVTDTARDAVNRFPYNRKTFILPPWQEIYETDDERKQSFAIAVETFETMQRTYEYFGYQPIIVPRLPVQERVSFILEAIDISAS